MKQNSMDKRIPISTKKTLRELNLEEARGWVIGRLIQIEISINKYLTQYFDPMNAQEFERVLLNSSILDMGRKIKLLANTGLVETKTIEKIRKMVAIRNGFAHAAITEYTKLVMEGFKTENKKVSIRNQESVIQVMNASGKIKSHSAYDYLVEFHDLNKEVRASLFEAGKKS